MSPESAFRSAARLGARLSQARIDAADEVAIATIAEEVIARIRDTTESTLRNVLRNSIASPHHSEWFEDVLEPFLGRYGNPMTMADEWRRDLWSSVSESFVRGRSTQPYWATRRRGLALIEGGSMPSKRRRRRAPLRLVRGGMDAEGTRA